MRQPWLDAHMPSLGPHVRRRQIDQRKVSAPKRGRLSGFSFERLLRFLVLLGRDVRIVVQERRAKHKQPRLLVA